MDKDFKRWRRLLYVLSILFLVIFFLAVRAVLLPFILAILLVYLVNPLLKTMERYGLSRLWTLYFLVFTSFVVGVIIFLYALPVLEEKLSFFTENMAELMAHFDEMAGQGQRELEKILGRQRLAGMLLQKIKMVSLLYLEKAVKGLGEILSHTLSIILAPLLAFYFLRDWEKIGQTVGSYFPAGKRQSIFAFIEELDCVVGGFIRGQFLISLIIGILAFIGLWIIGIDSALVLGVIAGFTNLIPYFGPFLGALLTLLWVLLNVPQKALWALGLFLGIQQLESMVISPLVLKATLGLHPLVIIFSVLVGGYLLGFWGLVIAVPLAGAIRVFLRYLKPFLVQE